MATTGDLGGLDPAGHHGALDGITFLPTPPGLEDLLDPFAGEDPHQVVFQRQEELRTPRVALAARAPAQLVVDAPAFVALGADNVQAAGFDDLLVALLPFLFDFPLLLFGGVLAEFLEFLRTDERFYADSPKELLALASYYAKKADGRLPQLFGVLRTTVVVDVDSIGFIVQDGQIGTEVIE